MPFTSTSSLLVENLQQAGGKATLFLPPTEYQGKEAYASWDLLTMTLTF